jgi:hypothetical protein
VTRIVTAHYRYKSPPRKRKAVALEVPTIVTTKRSRRPVLGETAAEVPAALPPFREEGASQPSTPRAATRVASPPANDEREPAIVTATNKKQLKLLRAQAGSGPRWRPRDAGMDPAGHAGRPPRDD